MNGFLIKKNTWIPYEQYFFLVFPFREMQRRLIQTKVYYKLSLFSLKRSVSQTFKSSSCKKVFLKCVYHWYNIENSKAPWRHVFISTSNHVFKREIWDKFAEITFLKFWNLPSEMREISKFQTMNEVNFSQISRINM